MIYIYIYTLHQTNIAMEHEPFEDVFPTETWELSIVMSVFQGVDATHPGHPHPFLGGGYLDISMFMFTLLGEMIQFDLHIFFRWLASTNTLESLLDSISTNRYMIEINPKDCQV